MEKKESQAVTAARAETKGVPTPNFLTAKQE
jgi:hypothetical protein